MTWITDHTGTRWVDVPQKKRRASPRALRFADLKVGDQIMLPPQKSWYAKIPCYFVVTDLWFDPVAGERDETRGKMVGYARIKDDGSVTKKSSTTLRGLASQGFCYSNQDYLSIARGRSEALKSGAIVPLAYGHKIRARPKVSGL